MEEPVKVKEEVKKFFFERFKEKESHRPSLDGMLFFLIFHMKTMRG